MNLTRHGIISYTWIFPHNFFIVKKCIILTNLHLTLIKLQNIYIQLIFLRMTISYSKNQLSSGLSDSLTKKVHYLTLKL